MVVTNRVQDIARFFDDFEILCANASVAGFTLIHRTDNRRQSSVVFYRGQLVDDCADNGRLHHLNVVNLLVCRIHIRFLLRHFHIEPVAASHKQTFARQEHSLRRHIIGRRRFFVKVVSQHVFQNRQRFQSTLLREDFLGILILTAFLVVCLTFPEFGVGFVAFILRPPRRHQMFPIGRALIQRLHNCISVFRRFIRHNRQQLIGRYGYFVSRQLFCVVKDSVITASPRHCIPRRFPFCVCVKVCADGATNHLILYRNAFTGNRRFVYVLQIRKVVFLIATRFTV